MGSDSFKFSHHLRRMHCVCLLFLKITASNCTSFDRFGIPTDVGQTFSTIELSTLVVGTSFSISFSGVDCDNVMGFVALLACLDILVMVMSPDHQVFGYAFFGIYIRIAKFRLGEPPQYVCE